MVRVEPVAGAVIDILFMLVAVATPIFGVTRVGLAPKLVRLEEVMPAASVVPVSVPAGATTAAVPAAVIRPLPFTVKFGIAVEDPKVPEFVLTVANVSAVLPGPAAVASPVKAVR